MAEGVASALLMLLIERLAPSLGLLGTIGGLELDSHHIENQIMPTTKSNMTNLATPNM